MSLFRAHFVGRLCWTAFCLLAIARGSRHEIFSSVVGVEASISETVSIPSQILRAKVPSSESTILQSQQQPKKQQLWLYEGALYDPLDGRKVAKVRGLELVQPLEDTSHLAIDALLKHPNATYESSKTVWSQKIFCYTTTKDAGSSSDDNVDGGHDLREQQPKTQESILDSVRVRTRSPRKEVPLDQAVAVYETATTFVSRKAKERKNANSNESGSSGKDETEVLVHSEWPNGQTMWGKARDYSQQSGDSATSSIDFTIFAKLRNKNSPMYSPDLIRSDESEDDTRITKSGDIIVSPKRASLVQFGSSDGTMETKHKFGARETYSYRNIPNAIDGTTTKNNWRNWFTIPWNSPRAKSNTDANTANPTIYYTRYGEGPPFYAPGRMCMLELRGRPISNLGEVGPLLRGLILGNSNSKEQNLPPPISNFHWNEEESAKKGETIVNDKRRRRKGAKGETSTSSSDPSTISIQTAWNLRETTQELLHNIGSKGNPTTKQVQRMRRTRQPLALKLVVPDDTTMATASGKRNWKVLTKRGRNCAMKIWDRIKASSTMESRS